MKEMPSENKAPVWIAGDKINEVQFCKSFLEQYPMICINDTFFTVNGRVTDENRLRKQILDWIKPYVTVGIPKKINNLLDTMRVMSYSEPLPAYTDRIHLANGTYFLSGEFDPVKDFCIIRLPNKKMSPFLSNINDDQPVLSLCKRFVSFSRRFIFQRS